MTRNQAILKLQEYLGYNSNIPAEEVLNFVELELSMEHKETYSFVSSNGELISTHVIKGWEIE